MNFVWNIIMVNVWFAKFVKYFSAGVRLAFAALLAEFILEFPWHTLTTIVLILKACKNEISGQTKIGKRQETQIQSNEQSCLAMVEY